MQKKYYFGIITILLITTFIYFKDTIIPKNLSTDLTSNDSVTPFNCGTLISASSSNAGGNSPGNLNYGISFWYGVGSVTPYSHLGPTGNELGHLDDNNQFGQRYTSQTPAVFAVGAADAIGEQTISVTCDTGSLIVYTPVLDNVGTNMRLYVASDGSTYHSRADHNYSTWPNGPDLTSDQAMVPEHLAKASSSYAANCFNYNQTTYSSWTCDSTSVKKREQIITGKNFNPSTGLCDINTSDTIWETLPCAEGETCTNGTCAINSLFVDKTFNAETQGFNTTKFNTIQSAINASNNDMTINVAAGTYEENITVNKNITLQGENAKTTIVDGKNISTVVTISASNAKIDGFSIKNSSITSSEVTQNTGLLIKPTTANNGTFTISNNYIFNNFYGIRLYNGGNSKAVINNNLIYNNILIGIHNYDFSNEISILQNTIVHNETGYLDSVNAGIRNIKNNIIINNNNYGVYFTVLNAITFNISYNNVWGNKDGNYITYNNGQKVNIAVTPGTGEISSNPHLISTTQGNYYLNSDSPCIATGENSVDMGAFPYTAQAVLANTYGSLLNLNGNNLTISPNGSSNVNLEITNLASALDSFTIELVDNTPNYSCGLLNPDQIPEMLLKANQKVIINYTCTGSSTLASNQKIDFKVKSAALETLGQNAFNTATLNFSYSNQQNNSGSSGLNTGSSGLNGNNSGSTGLNTGSSGLNGNNSGASNLNNNGNNNQNNPNTENSVSNQNNNNSGSTVLNPESDETDSDIPEDEETSNINNSGESGLNKKEKDENFKKIADKVTEIEKKQEESIKNLKKKIDEISLKNEEIAEKINEVLEKSAEKYIETMNKMIKNLEQINEDWQQLYLQTEIAIINVSESLNKSISNKINENLKKDYFELENKILSYHFVGDTGDLVVQELDNLNQNIENLSEEKIKIKLKIFFNAVDEYIQQAKEEKLEKGLIPFKDADDGDWWKTYTAYLKEKGVIQGYLDENKNPLGEYRPANTMILGEVLAAALRNARIAPGKAEDAYTYGYIGENNWILPYFVAAKEHNLTIVDNVKTFEDLIRPIDRGEAIMTYLQALEIQPILKEKASFPDITDHKARGYIEKAKEMGIVEGHPDGNFKPNDTINRAEFAAIAYRVIE